MKQTEVIVSGWSIPAFWAAIFFLAWDRWGWSGWWWCGVFCAVSLFVHVVEFCLLTRGKLP